MNNLFITSTRHNEGKTVVTLGLTAALSRRFKVGYMKPLGRGSVEFAGEKIDHDAVLIKEACKIPAFVRDMGPVCYDGFPTHWVSPEGRDEVVAKILSGYKRVAQGKDLILIEGTGNAAAGAAFGLSNAFLAKQLESKVLLVASGGVGQPTDEIILNKHYFERAGVEVLGVVVNKAYPHEFDRIQQWMRRVLDGIGMKLLGVIPYDADLARASLLTIFERFRGRCLNNEAGMERPLGRVVLGAMSPITLLEQISGNVTLICPVDREDLLIAALSSMFLSGRKDVTLSSIVVTDRGRLSDSVAKMLKRTTIPVLQVEPDAFSVVSELHASNFKILPSDTEKIRRAVAAVQEHFDLDAALQGLAA